MRAAAAARRTPSRRSSTAFATARRPLVVTSYLGRRPEAVPELVRLLRGGSGVGVLESVPSAMNFPHDHPLYQGNQWNEPRQNPALAEADCILVIDSDVPWIPTVSRPAADARDLPHRRRSAEGADAALVHRRAPVAARRRGDRARASSTRRSTALPIDAGARCASAPRTTPPRARAGAAALAAREAAPGGGDHAGVRHRLRAAAARRRHASC